MNLAKTFFSITITLVITLSSFAQSAEQKLNHEYLVPLMRLASSPQSGVVSINSPWFYWSPNYKSKTGVNTYKWDDSYQYQGQVSKSINFEESGTITSDIRDWAFFNPH